MTPMRYRWMESALRLFLSKTPQAGLTTHSVNHFKLKACVQSQRFWLGVLGGGDDMQNDAAQRAGKDDRLFTIGHPNFDFTQLPAHVAICTEYIS